MTEALFDRYGHPVNVLVDPDHPERLFDEYGRPVIVVKDASGLDLAAYNAISILARRGIWIPWLNHASSSAISAGSGVSYPTLNTSRLYTGTSADSKYIIYSFLLTLQGIAYTSFDFDRAFILAFTYAAYHSDSQAVRRLQLKSQATPDENQLAAKGVGLQVTNYTLTAESFGTERGELDLDTTLTESIPVSIVMVHTPGVSQAWYVNDVLKATQTDTVKIPSGVAVNANWVHAIKNGATGGVNAGSICGNFQLWQSKS
jgi:hypothetical protein